MAVALDLSIFLAQIKDIYNELAKIVYTLGNTLAEVLPKTLCFLDLWREFVLELLCEVINRSLDPLVSPVKSEEDCGKLPQHPG